jgi:putative Ca2+/H+ antiporter (TMEM165/GDT1 family)
MLYALIVAAIVIFIAEQGDKTQILAFALAAKYRSWQVMLGILVANSIMLLFFTLIGRFVGSLLPEFWIWVVSGVAFVAFGIAALRSKGEEEAEVGGRPDKYGPFLTTVGLFVLAEAGDSAELITMALAANPAGPLATLGDFGRVLGTSLAGIGVTASGGASTATLIGVWIGAVIGLTLADALAVVVGVYLGKRLPERLLRRVSGALFLVLGIVVLAVAAWSRLPHP